VYFGFEFRNLKFKLGEMRNHVNEFTCLNIADTAKCNTASFFHDWGRTQGVQQWWIGV
jgi:hypothetical protein